jgi:hypothetical protein
LGHVYSDALLSISYGGLCSLIECFTLFIKADNLTNGNIHAMVSTTPTLIYLAAGAAKVEELQPVLAVHPYNWQLRVISVVDMSLYVMFSTLDDDWCVIYCYSPFYEIAC